MTKTLIFQCFFMVFGLTGQESCPQTPPKAIEIFFSPGESPTAAIVRMIDAAKKSIFVQAYSFTSAPIADALRQAHKRGVNVQVILDKSQRSERYTVSTFLRNAGIEVWIDFKHAIAHNKVMIIDESIVITGSFNFTKSAEERNAENLLVIRDADVARVYKANWERCKAHSETK